MSRTTQGQILKHYREKNNLTIEKLAEKLKISRNTITNWETNKTEPSYSNLVDLARLYDISLQSFMPGEFDSATNNALARPASYDYSERIMSIRMEREKREKISEYQATLLKHCTDKNHGGVISIGYDRLREVEAGLSNADIINIMKRLKDEDFLITRIDRYSFQVKLKDSQELNALTNKIAEIIFNFHLTPYIDSEQLQEIKEYFYGKLGVDYNYVLMDDFQNIIGVAKDKEGINSLVNRFNIKDPCDNKLDGDFGYIVREYHKADDNAMEVVDALRGVMLWMTYESEYGDNNELWIGFNASYSAVKDIDWPIFDLNTEDKNKIFMYIDSLDPDTRADIRKIREEITSGKTVFPEV